MRVSFAESIALLSVYGASLFKKEEGKEINSYSRGRSEEVYRNYEKVERG